MSSTQLRSIAREERYGRALDEWLLEDHFARFVIAAVEALDLSGFYADYRVDGHGRPAHDPAMNDLCGRSHPRSSAPSRKLLTPPDDSPVFVTASKEAEVGQILATASERDQ